LLDWRRQLHRLSPACHEVQVSVLLAIELDSAWNHRGRPLSRNETPAIREVVMLSKHDAHRTAAMLMYTLGEVAVAAAMLRAQEAQAEGRYQAMIDWCRIAEAVVSRAAPEAGPGTAA
jgi:hypothetical protein